MGSGDGSDTIIGQRNQDFLAGNEGIDTLKRAMGVIDESFILGMPGA